MSLFNKITMLHSIRNHFKPTGIVRLNIQYVTSYDNYSSTPKIEGTENEKKESQRLAEFRKKIRETTSIDDLGEQPLIHPSQKNDPYQPFPDNTNPETGEVGGPRGPEPTRYGDWERKGRVSDF